MGWWGVNVMEGDPPMDAECEIIEILEDIYAERTSGGVVGEDDQPILFHQMGDEEVSLRVLQQLQSTDQRTDNLNISIQVLGEMIVCSGFPMPEGVRQAAIKAAAEDVWAAEDEERKTAMEVYAKRIADYNGTAIEPVSQGLFVKIFEHIADDKEGLINR